MSKTKTRVSEEADLVRYGKLVTRAVENLISAYNIIADRVYVDDYESEVLKTVRVEGIEAVRAIYETEDGFVLHLQTFKPDQVVVSRRPGSVDDYIITLRSGGVDVLDLVIPPRIIPEAVNLVANVGILKHLENLVNEPAFTYIVDTLDNMVKMMGSARKVKKELENLNPAEDYAPAVEFEIGGNVIKSVAIYADYTPRSDQVIYVVESKLKLGSDFILYHIPNHELREYAESFVKLVAHLGREKDLARLSKLSEKYLALISTAEALLKSWRKFEFDDL